MKLWMILTILSIWTVVFNIPLIGLILYLESTSDVLITFLGNFSGKSSNNSIRFYVFVFCFIFNIIFVYVLLWAIIKEKNGLCNFQNHFCIYEEIYLKNTYAEKKTIILTFVIISFGLIQSITSVLGFGIPIYQNVNTDIKPLVCLCIIIQIFPCSFPIFGQLQVLILYLQLYCNIKKLIVAFATEKMESTKLILRNAEKICQMVQSTSRLLSHQCFLMIIILLVNMICQVYMLIDMVLDPEFYLLSCIGLIFGSLYTGTVQQSGFK